MWLKKLDCCVTAKRICFFHCSTNNHSLILFPSELVNPDLPNIQCKPASNKKNMCTYIYFFSQHIYSVGTFKVLAENKYEAQARLDQEMRKYEATRIGRQDKDEDVPVAIVQARVRCLSINSQQLTQDF